MVRKFEPVQEIISPYAQSKLNSDFKYLFENVNVQGKAIQDLVAEGQLTEEQYAELITVINGLIKSGHVNKSDLTPEFKDEIEGLSTQLAQKAQQSDLIIERERINNLTAHAGDTDGNAELLDIRVGFDGTTYNSAGEAVRAIGAFLIEEGQSWGVEE